MERIGNLSLGMVMTATVWCGEIYGPGITEQDVLVL